MIESSRVQVPGQSPVGASALPLYYYYIIPPVHRALRSLLLSSSRKMYATQLTKYYVID